MDVNNTSSSDVSSASTDRDGKSDRHSNLWDCRICMQLPTDAVATSCGHVFCWPCIYRWLRNGPQPCPICRTHLNRDRDIIPLYGGPEATHGNGERDGYNKGNSFGGSGDVNSSAEASDTVCIPPRPRNRLVFLAGATARLRDSDRRGQQLVTNNNGEIGDGDGNSRNNSEAVDTVSIPPRPRNLPVNDAGATESLGPSDQADARDLENARNSLRNLVIDGVQDLSVPDSNQRNSDLVREADLSALRRMQEISELADQIGRLWR